MILAMTMLLAAVCIAQNTNPAGYKWKRVNDNVWPGQVNGEMYFYKLDKNTSLLWSPDGKKRETDSDGMWADKEGNFMKIDGGKVVWSPDGGNTWQDTQEWKWEAVNLKWYKLDKDWNLWVGAPKK